MQDYPRGKHNIWRLIARALHVSFPEESASAKRKANDRPVLDASAMRGLQLLAHHAPRDIDAFPRSVCPEEHHDIATARAWLDAANNDKE